jgi:CheY-like chemotaxis protein/HPt (histidine-containing phosphotransfer) domain-containing protein
MQGTLRVKSTPGEGSEFVFDIPLELAESLSPRAISSAPTPARVPRRRAHVLLAEDNPVNRRVATVMLERLGIDAETASNGREALEKLEKGNFDLLLLDCQMPELDGYETARAIRMASRTEVRELPIIAMTAHAMKGDYKRCLDAGMDDYLAKPVRMETLQTVLQSFLERKGFELTTQTPTGTSPTPVSHPEDPIDRTHLSRLASVSSSGNLVNDLIRLFLEESPKKIARIEEALKKKDAKTIERTCHDLKTEAGNLGARFVQAICQKLEAKGRAGDLSQAAELVEDLKSAFQAAKTRLRTHSGQGSRRTA